MSALQSLIEIFFIVAFLLFVYRYYNLEGASSMATPSFLMAILTVILAMSFIMLDVFGSLPVFGFIGYAAASFALLTVALLRMFRL